MKVIEEAQKEITRLENILRRIEVFLSNAPQGCLKWQNKKGKIYYYQQYSQDMQIIDDIILDTENSDKWKRKYIRKKDIEIAEALAQKHYLLLCRPIIERQLHELRRFTEKFPKDELENIYDSLSPERKMLVRTLEKSVKNKIHEWGEEKYEEAKKRK